MINYKTEQNKKGFNLLLVCGALMLLAYLTKDFYNVAKFKYPDIALTLYDQDWHGSPYTITEFTTHRWYEISQFGSIESNLAQRVKDSQTEFKFYLELYDNSEIEKEGIGVFVCVSQDSLVLTEKSSSLLSSNYHINSHATLEIHTYDSNISITDYAIKFNAKLKVTGLFNPEFVEHQAQELYILSSIKLINDYLTPRQ